MSSPVKGLCGRCFSEFIDGDTVSHVGVSIFDPALLTVAPLTFSLAQLSPPYPLPFLNKYNVYTYTVCGGMEFSASDR
jgi:hypothetical protein